MSTTDTAAPRPAAARGGGEGGTARPPPFTTFVHLLFSYY